MHRRSSPTPHHISASTPPHTPCNVAPPARPRARCAALVSAAVSLARRRSSAGRRREGCASSPRGGRGMNQPTNEGRRAGPPRREPQTLSVRQPHPGGEVTPKRAVGALWQRKVPAPQGRAARGGVPVQNPSPRGRIMYVRPGAPPPPEHRRAARPPVAAAPPPQGAPPAGAGRLYVPASSSRGGRTPPAPRPLAATQRHGNTRNAGSDIVAKKDGRAARGVVGRHARVAR